MRMEGEATVYSYSNEGGIALFAADPPESGAIVGGSRNPEEGSGATATRLRWWIMANGDGTYSGGITGEGWFRSSDGVDFAQSYPGPFEGKTDEEIYEIASTAGNLNSLFDAWNNAHSGVGDAIIDLFIANLKRTAAAGCIISGGVSG